MDGENNGKPYVHKWMIWGFSHIFGKISDLLLFLVLLLFLALLRRLQVNVRKGFKELLGSGVRFFYQSELEELADTSTHVVRISPSHTFPKKTALPVGSAA